MNLEGMPSGGRNGPRHKQSTKDEVAAQLGEVITGLQRVPQLERRVKALEEALAELMHQIIRHESLHQKINPAATAEELPRLLFNWALNVPLILSEDSHR